MANEKKDNLDGRRLMKNPDYYSVESDEAVFQMVKEFLEETVFGQPEACAEVAGPITRYLGELCDPNRPMYIGIFMGEPGVGKTEMGMAAAKIFDPLHPEQRLKVIDSSIFQESHDIHKIIGAPPSYVGYGDEPLITNDFLSRPNVLVFDEIEKAHPALHKLLLRVMDKARLDINGDDDSFDFMDMDKNMDGEEDLFFDPNILDFSQSIIILTSNIGSDKIRDIKSGKGTLGFISDRINNHQKDIQIAGVAAAENYWKHMPEFLNRVDSLVVFNSLTVEVVHKLFDKFLNQYYENQGEGGTLIMATDQLKEWVISQTDMNKAGRELKRKINKLIITPASEIKFKIPKGVPLIADISHDEPKRVIFWLSKSMVNSASKKR